MIQPTEKTQTFADQVNGLGIDYGEYGLVPVPGRTPGTMQFMPDPRRAEETKRLQIAQQRQQAIMQATKDLYDSMMVEDPLAEPGTPPKEGISWGDAYNAILERYEVMADVESRRKAIEDQVEKSDPSTLRGGLQPPPGTGRPGVVPGPYEQPPADYGAEYDMGIDTGGGGYTPVQAQALTQMFGGITEAEQNPMMQNPAFRAALGLDQPQEPVPTQPVQQPMSAGPRTQPQPQPGAAPGRDQSAIEHYKSIVDKNPGMADRVEAKMPKVMGQRVPLKTILDHDAPLPAVQLRPIDEQLIAQAEQERDRIPKAKRSRRAAYETIIRIAKVYGMDPAAYPNEPGNNVLAAYDEAEATISEQEDRERRSWWQVGQTPLVSPFGL